MPAKVRSRFNDDGDLVFYDRVTGSTILTLNRSALSLIAPNLPTSDPGVPGKLYTQNLGSPAITVIAVSQ